MYNYYDNKIKKNTVNLAPGEFYATGDDIVINTVLGSCVAVVLFDPSLKIGGMNHFMLAETKLKIDTDSIFQIERYGMYAMDALIGMLIKCGARRNYLQAKIFGGSRVIGTGTTMDIGADNIKFAEKYLKTENIPVISSDTGGTQARRIYLYTQTFKVLLRRVQKTAELENLMKDYRENLKKKAEKGGDAVIF